LPSFWNGSSAVSPRLRGVPRSTSAPEQTYDHAACLPMRPRCLDPNQSGHL
jgi:hypothetical protein